MQAAGGSDFGLVRRDPVGRTVHLGFEAPACLDGPLSSEQLRGPSRHRVDHNAFVSTLGQACVELFRPTASQLSLEDC